MLLDEPTTGLDSVNALRVGKLLKALANEQGRTVLCTIHSPSSELFHQFDDLLLLSQGHVIYHGPLEHSTKYFAVIGHPPPPLTNPSEFYMSLLQRSDLIPALAESLTPVGPNIVTRDPHIESLSKERSAGLGIQFFMLTARAFRLARRDPTATMGRLAQTIFFAIFIGLFFFWFAAQRRWDSGSGRRHLYDYGQQLLPLSDECVGCFPTGARCVLDGATNRCLQSLHVLPGQNCCRTAVSSLLPHDLRVHHIFHDRICEDRRAVLHTAVLSRVDCELRWVIWRFCRRVFPQRGVGLCHSSHHLPSSDACRWFVRQHSALGPVLSVAQLRVVSAVRLYWVVLE